MQASVILCFFQTTDYKLPRRNLVETCEWLAKFDVETIVVQGLQPGQAQVDLPQTARSVPVETKTAMFRKENLWNIGAKAAQSDILVFLDADIWIDNDNWVEDTRKLLQSADIVQPMRESHWTDRSGWEVDRKVAVTGAIARGEKLNFVVHHPGFGWAMKKRTFDAIGGFYDTCVSGAGDAAFAVALASQEQVEHLRDWLFANDRFAETPSFKKYAGHVRSLRLRLAACDKGIARHRWHGTSMGRNYVDRDRMFPRLPTGEHDLRREASGVLEWNDADGDRKCREYFAARFEDGRTPWLFGIGVPKSGTNSLHRALGILGISSRHLGSDEAVGRTDIHETFRANATQGNKPLDGIIDADALVDSPMPDMYRTLAGLYPDSRFVLTYRPPTDCALSWMRMIYYKKPKRSRDMSQWPEEIKTFDGYARWAERHVAQVLDYFKTQPERLLIMDCRDNSADLWSSLRRFVGRPDKTMYRAYPHAFSHSSWRQ